MLGLIATHTQKQEKKEKIFLFSSGDFCAFPFDGISFDGISVFVGGAYFLKNCPDHL